MKKIQRNSKETIAEEFQKMYFIFLFTGEESVNCTLTQNMSHTRL